MSDNRRTELRREAYAFALDEVRQDAARAMALRREWYAITLAEVRREVRS